MSLWTPINVYYGKISLQQPRLQEFLPLFHPNCQAFFSSCQSSWWRRPPQQQNNNTKQLNCGEHIFNFKKCTTYTTSNEMKDASCWRVIHINRVIICNILSIVIMVCDIYQEYLIKLEMYFEGLTIFAFEMTSSHFWAWWNEKGLK